VPHTDYIITMLDGRIVEQGTYEELVKSNGDFAQFISAFGSQGEQEKQEDGGIKETDAAGTTNKRLKTVNGTVMMQAEERVLGAVSWKVYGNYLRWAALSFSEYFPLLHT
jgi:ATP-binding cassette, subfamily C (CFTR/MRP), member 1